MLVLHAAFLTLVATLNSVWSFNHTDPAIMLIGGEGGLGPVAVLLLLLYAAILCKKCVAPKKNVKIQGMHSSPEIAGMALNSPEFKLPLT